MIVIKLRNKYIKLISRVLLISVVYQLSFPMVSLALTSGPSQPEMQSFEPVGTTDMVDMFSGDFNYNIPLLDVEGYPVNIAYHSGATIEQEASWVGLGWNINPGNINHIIRGVSDDYKGDEIKKTLEIKKEVNNKVGLFLGAELAGLNLDKLSEVAKKALAKLKGSGSQIDFAMNFSNYNGVSASFGQKRNMQINNIMPGVNLGLNTTNSVSTAEGADFDYGASVSIAKQKENHSLGFSINGGMNSRDGLKYTSFGVNPGVSANYLVNNYTSMDATFVPIGLQNYVAVNTNASSMRSEFFQLKVGGEVYALFPFGGGNYSRSTLEYDTDGSRNAYGYFYLDQAGDKDILDFTRDKDGRFSRASQHLPMASMTYDIYSVTGQGTGGSFRPFRDGLGTVYDPLTGTDKFDHSHIGELGFGNVFEVGFDTKIVMTNSKSGAWDKHNKKFDSKKINKLYEPFYFKQAGELTEANSNFSNTDVISYLQLANQLNVPNNNSDKRNKRANLLYFLNASEASLKQVSLLPQLENYNFDGFKNNMPSDRTPVSRTALHRKAHHASEYTQIQPDGRRYVYGLPAYNIVQKDYEFSVDMYPAVSNNTVAVSYAGGKPQKATGSYIQDYYSEKETPASVHSYLLTSIVSADYSDLTGDGISDDDLGSFTKFNYRQRENYQWRTPYGNNTAQYSKGLASDCNDNKGNISVGVREQWYVHSIESKNYVAEFFTSPRIDAKASGDNLIADGAGAHTYKLDSIVLFNKYDRFTNHTSAVPIKAVIFNYDYKLCQGAPNSDNNKGKLTLKGIFIRHGNSAVGLMSPYQFAYGNLVNPNYNFQAKDCWGNYKPANSNSDQNKNLNLNLDNTEFPYVNQNDPQNDEYANAWNLTKIQLPSGGIINIDYESDDYAYVQDKRAMEMYKTEGVGPTKEFTANNSLYRDVEDPYLYIYFKRKVSDEHLPTIGESYLDGKSIVQYNFNVEISPGEKASCPSTPLKESVKGYAKVVSSGTCSDGVHGYIQIEPKDHNTLLGLGDLGKNAKVNPITMAAINFARYYNMKALKPESDIPSPIPKAVIKELVSSMGENINFFQNPVKTYLKKQKGKFFDIDRSYIRLVSQGLKKKGGGNRVKRIEFTDNWTGGGLNSYGSDYHYTVMDETLGKEISSGVASYEPLFGGDENPNRTLQSYEASGNNSKFPPVDPIELLSEIPLGETLFPSAYVGYSKVSVTSIHKNEGASSQTIQEHEFYTAKDFPVTVKFNNEKVTSPVENEKKKLYELFHKKERLRVAETFSLYLNDMHGKMKRQSTWVNKDAAFFGKDPELVSYTKYEYFTENNQLNNSVPCLVFNPNDAEPSKINKTLGVETDFTIDSRYREQLSKFINIHFSSNTFLAPPLPINIPLPFPTYKKESSIFSSLTGTKVNQQYGIMKAVETYDKGAKVRVENEAFDPLTGQVLITKVNSEHNDMVYSIKYPAYWAYRCMGAAYENILYEENVDKVVVENDIGYIQVNDFDRYNIGDELVLTNKKLTCNSPVIGPDKKFKLWITGKETLPSKDDVCAAPCSTDNATPVKYAYQEYDVYDNPITPPQPVPCITLNDIKATIVSLTGDQNVNTVLDCISKVEITSHQYNYGSGNKPVSINSVPCKLVGGFTAIHAMNHTFSHFFKKEVYTAESLSPYPNNPPYPDPNNVNINGYKLLTYYVKHTGEVSYIPWAPFNGLQTDGVMNDKLAYTVKIWVPSNNTVPLNGNAICTPANNQFIGVTNNSLKHPAPNAVCFYELNSILTAKYDRLACQDIPVNQYLKKYLIVKAIKRNSAAINDDNVHWPSNNIFNKTSIKIVRSGKRNQLTDLIQELSTLDMPYSVDKLKTNFAKALAASSRSYTEFASVPKDIANPNDATNLYYNPFVTGQRGNYRVQQELLVNKLRDYNAISDQQKGTYAAQMYWNFGSPLNSEFFNRMIVGTGSGWYPKSYVNVYSPWGSDLQVEDAVHNKHANIFGYGNSLPVAVVSNSEYNTAMVDNFEDYHDYYAPLNSSFVQYFHNTIRKHIKNQLTGANLYGPDFSVTSGGHTGKYGLQIKNNVTISVDIISYPNAVQENTLYPFNFVQDHKFLVSLWQYIPSGTPPLNAAMNISIPGYANVVLKRKTPAIDGWAQYEGVLNIPTGNMLTANVNFLNGGGAQIIDDVRIMPLESNMKSYVYDYKNKKLVAVLDENNMATLFEYNQEGKLSRLKKETERGIITLKESRESLRHILGNPPQNGVFQDLTVQPVNY